MKHILCAILIAVALALPAKANEEIENVISSQIEAFLADDFEKAFTFASPTIQNIFRTPEVFGRMVRNGYPMVWRPSDVQFLTLEDRDGTLWQPVLMRDAEGIQHLLEYEMIQDENGWRINGVNLLKPTDGMA